MRGRLVLSSDVRTYVTGSVRVYGLKIGVTLLGLLFGATFCSKPSICPNLFVCHDKFSTILASIVGYDSYFMIEVRS